MPNSLAVQWNKWEDRCENLLTALGITDAGRKKALLLFYSGKDVHEIYNSIKPATDENYEQANRRLKD